MRDGIRSDAESPGFRRGLFVDAALVPRSPGWKPGDSGPECHLAFHAAQIPGSRGHDQSVGSGSAASAPRVIVNPMSEIIR